MAEELCCKPFKPELWDDKEITWENKKFVKDHVKCLMYVPINMEQKMKHNMDLIKAADAMPEEFLMLTYNSAFGMDLYIDVTKDVPDAEMTAISGTFMTKVFEGHYANIGSWGKEMKQYVADKGKEMQKYYTFFTTCPKCAKKYGKNYIVLFAQV